MPGEHFTDPESLFQRVPAALRHIHQQELVCDAWRLCFEALSTPAVLVPKDGQRCVIVARSACFTVDPSGIVTVSLMHTNAYGEFSFQTIPDTRVFLDPILARWTWLGVLKRNFTNLVTSQDISHRHDEVLAYADWVFARIQRALARTFDMRKVRTEVRSALGLSPFAMDCARRMRPSMLINGMTQKHHPLSLYNLAVQHNDVMQVLMREAPEAIGLWSFFRNDLPEHRPQDTLRVLKDHLSSLGLSERTWRLALKTGNRLFHHIPEFYSVPSTGMVGIAQDCLALVDALELERMPPRWLMHDLYAVFGNAFDRKSNYALGFGAPGRVRTAAHAMRVLSRMPDWGCARREEVGQVLGWLGDLPSHGSFEPDAASRRAGWRWLIGQARAYIEQGAREAKGFANRWEVPLGECEIDGVAIRPLDSGEALYWEGQQMSHCLSHRLEDCCEPSKVLLYSVCRGENRRPNRATVSIWNNEGSWEVGQVLGFANLPARGWAQAIAMQIAERVNAIAPGSAVEKRLKSCPENEKASCS
jgi:hypothetical protein